MVSRSPEIADSSVVTGFLNLSFLAFWFVRAYKDTIAAYYQRLITSGIIKLT